MRRLEALAERRYAIPSLLLMEHAGIAVAREVLRSRRGTGPVIIMCSHGNNGGDGLVVARLLDNAGVRVRVVMVGELPSGGPAAVNWAIVRRLRVPIVRWRTAPAAQRGAAALRNASVIVDALLGTGTRGYVREPIASAIRAVNGAGRPVVSVDLPSGLEADAGTIGEVAVRARVTVTCGRLKRGLVRGQGPAQAGRVIVADITFPRILRT